MISDSKLAPDFLKNGRSDACPVIDMHGHMGGWAGIYFPAASAEAMAARSAGAMSACATASMFAPW